MKKCIFILLTCLTLNTAFAFLGFGSSEKKQELQQVNQQISGLQDSISQEQQRQEILQNGLQTSEEAIGVLSVKLTDTNSQLQLQRQKIALLAAQESTYQLNYHQQQQSLADAVKSAYMLGQHDYLKLLLSQNDANQISRILIYYKFINQHYAETLQNMQSSLSNIASTQSELQSSYQALEKLQSTQQDSQQNLQSQLSQRQQILGQINNSLQSKDQQLNTLLANKQALEQLVNQLNTPSPKTPVYQQPAQPFANMQGKLTWPTIGQITQRFGSSVDQTSVTSEGVFIDAPQNQPVRAVYPGRVIFAGWLRGIGMLIILDHGNGYMTLYGHDHSLFKKVGDVVKAGDEIADVGFSGGDQKSGLYFQIRANGQPLNPETWCH